jgi:hypothetical protein
MKIFNKMEKKEIIACLIMIIVIGLICFFIGAKCGSGKMPGNMQNLPQRSQNREQLLGKTKEQSTNIISGEIISKDDISLTIKLRDGGSKIIFFSNSTQITKPLIVAVKDMIVGDAVIINGVANSDGSLTATSIQIREADNLKSNQISPNNQL